MISASTAQWLAALSTFGWIWIIPLVERLFPLRGQPLLRKGIVNDLIHTYHPLRLWTLANTAFAAWLAAYAQQASDQTLPLQGALSNAHWAVSFIAIVLLSQITFYVAHYCCHKVPFLWQFHRVHHSSVQLDSFSTSRFHVLDKTLFALPFLASMTYLAPDPGLIIIYGAFNDFWGRYGHGDIKDPYWLGYVLSNPRFHRWHHSNDPEAIDKNFSGEFNFLDYLFGTAYYPKDRDPGNFGDEAYTHNILVQHYRPFADCYQIARQHGPMALLRKPRRTADDKLAAAHD